jgi:futalosine hydrolase
LKNTFRILIAVSSEFEIHDFRKKLIETGFLQSGNSYRKNSMDVYVEVTGIGIAAMTYHLTKALESQSYRLVINAGIGGSFSERFPVGACARILSEAFADLGMTRADGSFMDLYEELPAGKNSPPFKNGELHIRNIEGLFFDLPEARGITVQNCSGNPAQIQFRAEHFNADIESMEGAAATFVCLSEGIDFIEIRAVSNRIEARDKSKWNIPKALDKLSDCLIGIIANLETNQNLYRK